MKASNIKKKISSLDSRVVDIDSKVSVLMEKRKLLSEESDRLKAVLVFSVAEDNGLDLDGVLNALSADNSSGNSSKLPATSSLNIIPDAE